MAADWVEWTAAQLAALMVAWLAVKMVVLTAANLADLTDDLLAE